MRKRSVGVFILIGILITIALTGLSLVNFKKSLVSNEINQPRQHLSIPPQTSQIIPSKDWKIYTDESNNFTIMYPSDIFIRLICPEGGLNLIRRQNKDHYENRGFVNLSRCGGDAKYAFELKTSKTPIAEPKSDQFYTVTKEEILMSGVIAQKYTAVAKKEPKPEEPAYPSWYIEVLFDYKNKIYEIHFDESSEIFNDEVEMKKTFSQILSTFRFLN